MRNERNTEEIHISEIDEYLAARILQESGAPLGLSVEKCGDEGFITLTPTGDKESLGKEAIDFELSSSEYLNLDDREIGDLLKSPLITSSAHELFDFLLLRFTTFNCLLEFTGNAWKVKIKEPL